MSRNGVLVVGSISADVTAFADRLPQPGETVLGNDVTLVLGGKGANQAVAAARFGAPTWMVGCVGDDAFADLTAGDLRRYGVNTDLLRSVPGPTGVAHIRVDANGQNDIVNTPLANGHLDADQVDGALAALASQASVLLLQLEVRAGITAHAAEAGRRAGLAVVLDPAPAVAVPETVWQHVDIVTPNESEAGLITGIEVTGVDTARKAAQWFLDRGVRQVVITLGGAGAVSVTAAESHEYAPFAVTAVDTTAAGDAFTGTLGAALALGLGSADAIRHAMAAGALAVTKRGASPSLPDRDAVLALAGRPATA
ncbi:ribokinase [Planosporangium thailandense]|uniref:Ribokinase n=1 Tax=Planosporangium thailandense TaxID=765197 RepID=A0ABX0XRG8_9ACTN|nr:ribokinase [Planosporangium thailandense]